MPGLREEGFKRNNAFSICAFNETPQAEEPLHWGLEIYNFGIPFLRHHYYMYALSFSE